MQIEHDSFTPVVMSARWDGKKMPKILLSFLRDDK